MDIPPKSSTSSSSSSSTQQQQQQRQRLIPTRHSSKRPPPVCRDAAELQELTQELLETPVGELFVPAMFQNPSQSRTDDRDEAYDTARESGELVEYLLRGYNSTVSPLALCSSSNNNKAAAAASTSGDSVDLEQVSASLEKMMDVMERFHQEGNMYLRLRKELGGGLDSSGSSSTSSSSSSSSSDDDDDSLAEFEDGPDDPKFSSVVQDKLRVDAQEQQQQSGSGGHDFAKPGVTMAMYDAILDAMACAAQASLQAKDSSQQQSASYLQSLEPEDIYRVAGAAWKAHDLNNQHNNDSDEYFQSTCPTMVTYNAALRGIGNLCLAADPDNKRKAIITDQGLAHGFGVYNHLTHNEHGLPKRNSASIVYLLQIIRACFPASRSRGNMTVALWHQASREGLVTPGLIRSLKDLHAESNGPEFGVFLESLDRCISAGTSGESKTPAITPQRFARFAKKYSHSKFY